MDKFWADLWEAYWGALFLEREMWNDDQEDLTACLRGLFCVRYPELIDNYAADRLFTLGPLTHKTRDDVEIDQVTILPNIEVPNGAGILAYRARLKDSSKHRIVCENDEAAIAKLLQSCNSSWSTCASPPSYSYHCLTYSQARVSYPPPKTVNPDPNHSLFSNSLGKTLSCFKSKVPPECDMKSAYDELARLQSASSFLTSKQ